MPILYLLTGYLLVGTLFSLIFITQLIQTVDKATLGSSWTFKLIILPGCVVFWPVMLRKYLNKGSDTNHD